MHEPYWLVILPPRLKSIICQFSAQMINELEEIRIREQRPLEVIIGGKFHLVTGRGEVTDCPDRAYRPGREESCQLLDYVTNHSLYTMEEQLRRGFITITGGHRIGLAGRTVLMHGQVSHLRDITSFNLRIARERIGIAESIMPLLLDFTQQSIYSTLIVSPPQHGKTTLLRDIARAVATGSWNHPHVQWGARKVGIVDERSEIAGCLQGVPSFNVGYRTDIMDGCPKAEGMMMMIRSMSPDVLIVDELGRQEDWVAINEAVHAGIRLVASVHGAYIEDMIHKPYIASLLDKGHFARIVMLKRTGKQWSKKVYDGQLRALHMNRSIPIQKGVRRHL